MKQLIKPFALAALLGLAQSPVHAQVLDEIEIIQVQDATEARIQFNVPVHYLRFFPLGNADTYEIFFQIISSEGIENMPTDEYKISPPSGKLPRFTVTYPKQGPSRLVVQFCHRVDLKVRPGDDNRSFLLSIKPVSAAGQPVVEPCKEVSKKTPSSSNNSSIAAENTAPASNTNNSSTEIKTPTAEPQQPATENTQPASEGSK